MTSLLGPLPTGQAIRALGLTSRAQMNKLIDCGLIPVVETTPSGQRRVDSASVLDLAAWPYAPEPGPSDSPLLAVHLGPLQVDNNGIANQRTHRGYHVDPAAAGLTPRQVEDAWAGLWNCDPGPYAGSFLVGDVSGFVVAVARITGYKIINRAVRFDLSAPPTEILARYMRHRITARKGAPFQAL
jgi:hypothetical protein